VFLLFLRRRYPRLYLALVIWLRSCCGSPVLRAEMFVLFFHGRLSEVQICFNYSMTTTAAFAAGCDSNSDTSLLVNAIMTFLHDLNVNK